jgi:hypothetical protein
MLMQLCAGVYSPAPAAASTVLLELLRMLLLLLLLTPVLLPLCLLEVLSLVAELPAIPPFWLLLPLMLALLLGRDCSLTPS